MSGALRGPSNSHASWCCCLVSSGYVQTRFTKSLEMSVWLFIWWTFEIVKSCQFTISQNLVRYHYVLQNYIWPCLYRQRWVLPTALECLPLVVIPINCINIVATALLDPVFFSERVVNLWNSLPADHISFTSLSAFKNFLKTVDLQSLTL